MDFNYCLWFINSEDHSWNIYREGFYPHLTIKSKLEYTEALELYELFKTIEPVQVRLKEEVIHSNENGFHALYFQVILVENIEEPYWWKEIQNPHISFRYQYNKDFSKDEIKHLKTIVKEKIGKLTDVKLVNCRGHYETWHFLNV
jgi:hypothetical protein